LSSEHPPYEGRLLLAVTLALGLVAALAGVDVALDLREGAAGRHVLVEVLVIVVALGVGGLVARRLVVQLRASRVAASTSRQEAQALAVRLDAAQADAHKWRAEARTLVQGLGAAIDRQFTAWQLTAAEREVGLLLLKGLSHKEIAAARAISEATARQQARAVYRKAGLTGRADLAAFFLEDLLLPSDGSASSG
jgi:DNA-binding CsgD family transcriptional regulator